jgi:hypothetical protein
MLASLGRLEDRLVVQVGRDTDVDGADVLAFQKATVVVGGIWSAAGPEMPLGAVEDCHHHAVFAYQGRAGLSVTCFNRINTLYGPLLRG